MLSTDPLAHALFAGADTASPHAVATALAAIEKRLFPAEAEAEALHHLVSEVEAMFEGRFAFFQAMDTPYHDFEHTLQATLCWAQLALGYARSGRRPQLTHEFFRIGLVAILLHDIGYLKDETDEHGTGAKFTAVHERRSCELAHVCLSANGWAQEDIFAIQHMISCTGPRAVLETIPFRHRLERILGQMVCTADYLGQLSDPRYVEKIPALYREFEESDAYRGLPPERRAVPSLEALYARTGDFWRAVVQPRLEGECGGLLHTLASPEDGRNAYLEAIESNLARVGLLSPPGEA